MLQTGMRGLIWAIAQSGVVAVALAIGLADGAIGQIVPDDTLGAESSRVTPNVQVRGRAADRIDGGAARGANLFHSFREFNVGEGQRVYFANPIGVENILSRVTGENVSNILGTLGVDGGANLFLINPNGIVFGQNARLDVSGSFVGSTANRFTFADGSEFSATNPQAAPLLTVSVPIGLQFGATPTGAIANQGNLAAGQDLTLSGNTLDLQGQLQAGRNLTLQAQDRLQVRDTVTNPFIAAAGNQMVVQGDRSVDIFALNHPNSGFFSGGDMVLRSSDRVGGDAHFWSGGNFAIEQLDGSLGNLYSPNDPVIRSLGDVSFNNYLGASLHILAAGSVDIGAVVIGGLETGTSETNYIQETVKLSNGSEIAIDGSSQPTLDIRSGVNPNRIGFPGTTGLGNNFFFDSSFVQESPSLTANPANADITIGQVFIDSPNGLVLLTNQYQPNNLIADGNITIRGLGGARGRISTSSQGGNSSITLDSRGDITLANSFIDSSSTVGNAGNVSLIANRDISLSGRSYIDSSSTVGNAGDINILANGDVSLSSNRGRTNLTSDP